VQFIEIGKTYLNTETEGALGRTAVSTRNSENVARVNIIKISD
jgi:hypothetical protein